jgi:diacylglycerol kinase (ATP)
MAHWVVVLNPAAGRTATVPASVSKALDAIGLDHEMVVPGSRQETVSALREAAMSGIERFCVVGGDGTVNLAVNTLLGAGVERPVIGVLPGGTGCDLMRTFAHPKQLAQAASHLTTDALYDADVVALEGEWGLRYFINVGQVGVGAAAAETALRVSRRFGSMRYPLAFAVRLPRFPRARVTVTTEKRTYEAEALAVIMANAQYFAGGWNVAPRANLIDGLIDIQVVTARKRQAPALVPKVIRGTHLSDPSVRRFQAARFKIETDVTWPLEVDGDLVGNTPVSGRVVPAAVRLKI